MMFNCKILLCLVGIVGCLPFIHGKKLFLDNFDSANNFKYHVSVLKVLPDETTEIICGGAIIDKRYVLTAAHCIYDMQKSELLIRSGSDIAPTVAYQERRSFHKIVKITYPKDYVHAYCRHHEHDIALLKVENRFDLADTALYKKLNLPLYDNDYEKNEAIFTGYGFHNTDSNSTTEKIDKEVLVNPDELKYVNARVISNEECRRSAPAIITTGNICTQSTNPSESSCLGDDGGPLVYDGALIGIRNSYNTKCTNKEPEIYTRVSSYLKFINKVLNQENSYDIVYI